MADWAKVRERVEGFVFDKVVMCIIRGFSSIRRFSNTLLTFENQTGSLTLLCQGNHFDTNSVAIKEMWKIQIQENPEKSDRVIDLVTGVALEDRLITGRHNSVHRHHRRQENPSHYGARFEICRLQMINVLRGQFVANLLSQKITKNDRQLWR